MKKLVESYMCGVFKEFKYPNAKNLTMILTQEDIYKESPI